MCLKTILKSLRAPVPPCPTVILLVPLKIDDVVYGVLELATVRLLRPFEIEFVESLSESITSSLLAVRTSERTADLLKQSQAQAEALKNQERAMRENMEKLETGPGGFQQKRVGDHRNSQCHQSVVPGGRTGPERPFFQH